MDEHVENLPPEPPPQKNRGWFQPGDRRINRDGRPLGSKKAGPGEQQDGAPCADRLMLLALPERHVAFRLTHLKGGWVVNAPGDLEIVSSRGDSARGVVIFVIRSET